MMDALHFLRPYWLCALLPVTLGWWWYGFRRHRRSIWNQVAQPAFVRLLVDRGSATRWFAKSRHWLAAACAVAVIAMAGPAWQRSPQAVFRSRAALVIALDLSQSMLAQDITPSRVKRARLKIRDLLSQRERGDTALIVYAANAYAVTPLTHDVRTVENLIAPLEPTIMPRQGTNPRAALELAAKLIHRSGRRAGDVLLVTDGLGGEKPGQLAASANKHGLRVSVLAVATTQAARVPGLNGIGTLHYHGRPVTSTLDRAPLEKLAAATGGLYQPVRRDAQDIKRLQRLFGERHGGYRAVSGQATEQWRDLGPWLLLFLCLPMAAYMFRRNFLFLLALGILVPVPQSQAATWTSIFLNDNQRGLAAYQQGRYQTAEHLFSDPRWRAAAAFKQGDLKKALTLYSQLDDIASVYNRGNALVKLARFKQALEAYNEVLARDPGNADAAYNKAQVLKLLDKLTPRSQNKNPARGSGKKENSRSANNRESEKTSKSAGQAKRSKSARAASKKNRQSGLKAAGKSVNRHETRRPSLEAEANQAASDKHISSAEYRLRRIPDDPAGLLRRKFLYQYEHRAHRNRGGGPPW